MFIVVFNDPQNARMALILEITICTDVNSNTVLMAFNL